MWGYKICDSLVEFFKRLVEDPDWFSPQFDGKLDPRAVRKLIVVALGGGMSGVVSEVAVSAATALPQTAFKYVSQSPFANTALARIAPDTSRDAFYVAQTDKSVLIDNKFDMNHVLAGEINAKGKVTCPLPPYQP